MTKSKSKVAQAKKKSFNNTSFLDRLSQKHKTLIGVILLIIPLLYFFLPWQINNVIPTGNDMQSIFGQTHKWVEYRDATGETVLWNPNIFLGEPIYSRLTPLILHIDSAIVYLSKIVFYWTFWYMLLGGLGFIALLKYKKIPWYAAIIAAVAFILLPDWFAQIGEGHTSKLRAIMTLPWVFLSFSYFFDKRNWLSVGLFAFAFSWLVRTHHFQIVFYGILLLFLVYIYPTLKEIIDRKYKDVGLLALKFSIALLLTFLTTAQPLFTTNEYAKYSTRGGHPVNIGESAKSAEKGGGVSFEYATQWSFAPSELLDFFMPRFSGGVQGEIYDGTKYKNLVGQQVPGYWGEKPFNGNYTTVGIILFMFSIVGFIKYKNDKFVLGLFVFAIFSLLLSFGRHFPEMYKLFFYYFPYFSKFRAPAMIVNITFIVILILSGYGIKAVTKDFAQKDLKWMSFVFSGGVLIALGTIIFSGSFAYLSPREVGQFSANNVQIIKDIRQEFLVADAKTMLFFSASTLILVLAFLFKKIKLELFVLILLLLSSAELFKVSNKIYNGMSTNNSDKLEQSIFKETPISRILRNDKSDQRAIVLGRGFTDNHYAYFYPLISGYSAIKLQLIQDIVEHNLYNAKTPSRINWNLINMLAGKFVITKQALNEPNLRLIANDKSRKESLYENINAYKKAWFIKNIILMESPEEIVLAMNESNFNPSEQALIKSSDENLKLNFSGEGNINIIKDTPNRIEYKISCNEDQFAVLSEMYYEKGWRAFLDDVEVPIYQVNHVLRGVQIKQNSKKLVLKFMPQTYYSSLYTLWIGNLLILGLIGFGFYRVRLKNIENT